MSKSEGGGDVPDFFGLAILTSLLDSVNVSLTSLFFCVCEKSGLYLTRFAMRPAISHVKSTPALAVTENGRYF